MITVAASASSQDRLDDVGLQQRQAQDAGHVGGGAMPSRPVSSAMVANSLGSCIRFHRNA